MGSVTALTPADLLTMGRPPGGKHYELADSGDLIVVGNAGPIHERTKSRLLRRLISAVPESVGAIYSESQFAILRGARIPDIAFVSSERDRLPGAPTSIAPDLAVEIISDSETATATEQKLREYLAAGVQEVWQMHPELLLIRVHTPAGSRAYQAGDVIASPLLPGFSATVRDLFPPATIEE